MTRFIRPARIAKSNENQQGVTDGAGQWSRKRPGLGPGLFQVC
jgi:hypothetical protein